MPDIKVTLRVNGENVEVLDQTANKLQNIGDSARGATSGTESFAQGVQSVVQGVMQFGAAATAAALMIDKFNEMGVTSLRTKAALDTLTGGQSVAWINQLREATQGLVDDQTLAHQSTVALTTGVVQSSAEMAKLAHDGAILGLALGQTAAQGVETLTRTLEMTGNYRGIRQIGLDADDVRQRYEALVKSGVEKSAAWRQAVMEVADAMSGKLEPAATGVGTAMDRIKAGISNTVTDWAERFASALERALVAGNQLAQIVKFYDQQAMGDVNAKLPINPGSLYSPLADPLANRKQQIMSTDFLDAGAFGGARTSYLSGSLDKSSIYYDAARQFGTKGTPDDPQAYLKAYQQWYTSVQESTAQSAFLRDKGAENFSGYQNGSAAPADSATLSWMRMGDALAAQQRFNDAVGQGKSMWQALQDAANNALSGIMQKVDQAAQKARETSIAGAFGLQSGGTYGEVGSYLEKDVNSQRAALEKQLQKQVGTVRGDGTGSIFYGGGGLSDKDSAQLSKLNDQLALAKAHHDDLANSMSHAKHVSETMTVEYQQQSEKISKLSSQIGELNAKNGGSVGGGGRLYTKADMQRDLDAFDRSSEDAVNAYKIATGAATPQSIEFNKALASISKSASEGKISLAEASKEYLTLADAARQGKTELKDIDDIMAHNAGMGGSSGEFTGRKTGRVGAGTMHMGDDDGVGTSVANMLKPATQSAQQAQSVFQPIIDILKSVPKDPFGAATTSADTLKTHTAQVGTTSIQTGIQMAGSMIVAAAGVAPLTVALNTALTTIQQLRKEASTPIVLQYQTQGSFKP